MSDSTFSEFSAQDTHLAALEAQEWIEAVVGKKFPKATFRESLEDGILLCELMNKVNPGAIRRINKSKSPIAYLDNIQQFLYYCQDLGLNNAQLFDTMDLQEIKAARRVGIKRNEADRRIRSVCITLYWLGRSVSELEDYKGPQLDLDLFKKLMDGNFSEPEDEGDQGNGDITSKQLNHDADPLIEYPDTFDDTRMESPTAFEDPHIESPPTFEDPQIESPGTLENDDFGLTFEQEQTADELLADIQNAVDEMLQDFQTSPVTVNPPPVAPKKKRDIPQKKIPSSTRSNTVTPEQQVLIKSKNGGFGFQIMGGVDSDLQAQVDYIVPGSAADASGLQVGDMMICVNGQNIQQLSHVDLVSVIKKAGQQGKVTLGINRTVPSTVEGKTDHAPLSDSHEELFGFSRRESREKWEEDNEERERQAQEIALLYPLRSAGPPHPIENGGPPTTFGTAPLPPLVEHQEEALFEQFQEMLDSAPSPPPSPQANPSSSSRNSSHPITPLTVSPTNQLQDDKETIERETEELALMEAAKPTLEDTQSVSASENEEEREQTNEEIIPAEMEGESDSDQEIEAPIELESEDTVAIKYDTFRVEETNSPLPLTPITEVSEMSPRPDGNEFTSSGLPVTVPPPDDKEPGETLDRELDELLKFSESSSAPDTPQPIAVAMSSQNEDLTPSDAIVTPPPMFDSPPPPKPKSEAPKRVAKRPAPPPPKPKPKRETTPPEPQSEQEAEPEAPAMKVVDTSPSKGLEGTIYDNPFQRSHSPDLVTQMQALAYSKSITFSADWMVTKPQGTTQPDNNSSSPSRYSQRQTTEQEKKTSSLPRNMHMGLLHQSLYQQNQSANPRQQNPAISSNGFNLAPSNTTTAPLALESTTPKLVEVVGNIKIQHVMKKRWTPKSSSVSAEASPEHQQPPANNSKGRSATLPNIFNGYGHATNGAPVVAKGIGTGIGRPSGVGQTQMRFQPIPAKGNPYQQNLQQQESQPWRSQEELRANQKASQYARQRFASTPDGTQDYRLQKSTSLPRGSVDNTRNSKANTWTASRGGGATTVDGYQVVYATQASSPHNLCSRCHQPLGQGTVLSLPTLKTVYHVKCLVCRVCRGTLTQGGQSTSVLVKNRQPHCRYCISGDNGTQTTEC